MPETRLFQHSSDARSVPAGTTIYREGDARDYMYAVVEGEVDLFVKGRQVETVGQGGIFGEMALIDQTDRIATAVARTAARVVPVDERRFLFMIQETPNFSLHVMRVLSDRLRRLDPRLIGT